MDLNGKDLLDDLVAESGDLGVEGFNGLLLLILQIGQRLLQLRINSLPALRKLLLHLRLSFLLHLSKGGGNLCPGCPHDGGGLLVQLLDLPGGVLDAVELLLDGGVSVVHELAERREVDLVEGDHEEQELGHHDGESEVEVEQGGLLDFLGEGRGREGERCGGEEGEGFESGG